MNGNRKNSIFLYAVTGVLFIVATFGLVVNNLTNLANLNGSTIITTTLGIAGLSLLAKAIKDDRNSDQDSLGQI